MQSLTNKIKILEDLVKADKPMRELRQIVFSMEWDETDSIVTLKNQDICRILEKFIRSQINESELQLWGELIECREEIYFVENFKELIKDFIFEISNPEINGTFTRGKALTWQRKFNCIEKP